MQRENTATAWDQWAYFAFFDDCCYQNNKQILKKIFYYLAGRSVTEGEVEEMLESGNPAVFTQGVSVWNIFMEEILFEKFV